MTELPGSDAEELAAMLRRAAATGLPQVSAERHAVDRERGKLAEEILSILAHSLGGGKDLGEVEPEELRELRDQLRGRLRDEGIDPDSGHAL